MSEKQCPCCGGNGWEGSDCQQQRWIPVKERLPWKGHCILALDERSVINITFRMDDQWAGVNPNIAITHWMPLPEPPKKEVQG